jgi:hypothetical protein
MTHCAARFLFPLFQMCAIVAVGSQKGASAAGGEAGMGRRTDLAKHARRIPYGEALRRRIFARPPAPAVGGRVGQKSGSQFGSLDSGFARKTLKSPDARKKEAWNSLPLALNFLPYDLDFPSPGFGNPSTHFVKSRLSTPLPQAFIERRAAGEAPFSAREAPAVQDV